MKWTEALIELRDAVAEACDNPDIIRRYVGDAGWPVSRLTFRQTTATDMWRILFEEGLAMDDQNLIKLSDLLVRDFKHNSRLTAAVERYRASLNKVGLPHGGLHHTEPVDAATAGVIAAEPEAAEWLCAFVKTLQDSDLTGDPTSYSFLAAVEKLGGLVSSAEARLDELTNAGKRRLAPRTPRFLDACSAARARLGTFTATLQIATTDPEAYRAAAAQQKADVITAIGRVIELLAPCSITIERRA